jgi:hypothetical protein
MAQLTFTVPNAALLALNAYAQRRNYIDFHALAIEWMKNSAHNARREQNELDAQAALAQANPDVVVT